MSFCFHSTPLQAAREAYFINRTKTAKIEASERGYLFYFTGTELELNRRIFYVQRLSSQDLILQDLACLVQFFSAVKRIHNNKLKAAEYLVIKEQKHVIWGSVI